MSHFPRSGELQEPLLYGSSDQYTLFAGVTGEAPPERSVPVPKPKPAAVFTPSKIKHLLVLRRGQDEAQKQNEKQERDEKIIVLEAATYSVGRHEANSIVIDDLTVSRHHAILLRIPDAQTGNFLFRIVDGNLQGMRSQNGIWVNGVRCYSRDLKDNDVIALSEAVEAVYYQVKETSPDATDLLPYSPIRSCSLDEMATRNSAAEDSFLSESALVRLSSFPEMMPHPIIEMDVEGYITYLNPAATEQFPGIRQNHQHPCRVGITQSLLNHPEQYYVREIEVGDQLFEQSIHCIPQSRLIRSYLLDVTQRRQMEQIVRKSEERYALAARGANDGLWDWDLLNDTMYFSPRWKSMIGFEEEEISAHKKEWFERVHPEDRARLKQEMNAHLKGEKDHFECEYRLLHKSGDYRFFRSRGMAVQDENDHPYRIAGSQTDITEYQLAREQLIHDAFYDAMTGLPNRVLFMDRVGQALKKCRRMSQRNCAVLFFDLDRFKVVNDSLGHMMGDQLLIEVSQRLSSCLRNEDTVARLGGDEFVALLDGVDDVQGAIATAVRIQESLNQVFILDGQEVYTSASIGIALGSSYYEQPEELLRDADVAMYQAKHHGKNRYAVFSRTMHSQAIELLQLENDLRRALERGELTLYYQPIINLKTSTIFAFEALMRWRHPERGLVMPSDFIPLAEDTGLIVPMGYWLIQQACEQIYQWQQQQNTPLEICVNISSRQFSQADFVPRLKAILAEVQLPPQSLKLEITESAIMQNSETIAQKIQELKTLGIKLSIDDFGTGYSSLSYLQTFSVDTLKIDRSFVMKMGSTHSREIVKTIVALAHNLNLDVVAEGVETKIQAQLLKEMNCESVQGYYYSRPVNAQEAEELLETFYDISIAEVSDSFNLLEN